MLGFTNHAAMEPNRVAHHWSYLRRKLQERYPRVAPDLWTVTDAETDQIVRLVRDTYAPGRSELTVEAEVRDAIQLWLEEIETVE